MRLMKFKIQSKDLVEALSMISTVKPRPLDSKGTAGYLCVIRGESCFFYSEDEQRKVRIKAPIFDVEGEGAFVFPLNHQSEFKHVEGWVELEPIEKDGVPCVIYTDQGGNRPAAWPTFDARSLNPLDKDFSNAQEGPLIPSALLKEAITVTRPYVGDVNDATTKTKPHYLGVHLLDAQHKSYNGFVIGASGQRTGTFFTPELRDKGLSVHQFQIPLLLAFLNKSKGDVRVKTSETATYIVNSNDQVIGWANQVAPPAKFGHYGLSVDTFIFRIPKAILERVLLWTREAIPSDRDKIQVRYSHEDQQIRILAQGNHQSMPIGVTPLDESDSVEGHPIKGGSLSKKEDLQFNVSVNWLLDIVSSVRVNEIELRIAPYPQQEDAYYIRTIETFNLDENGKVVIKGEDGEKVYPCRVMRFIPSK